ncbi:MAG: DUF4255 domain-containing protein [Cyanophyceae cyanobacterium]
MSNHLAIATVTAALQRMLQSAAQAGVPGARVTTMRPGQTGAGSPETGINLFLYQINPLNWGNSDLTTRLSGGQLVRRPQVALELQYLLSFYGNDVDLEPQRLLGTTLRQMHARPILTAQMVRDVITDPMFDYLGSSDLLKEVDLVKFSLIPLTTEDLSKIWSVFFQTPYSLSVAYRANLVAIESEDIPLRALPVRKPVFRTNATPLQVDQLVALSDLPGLEPAESSLILIDSTVGIRGRRLADADQIRIKVGTFEVEPLSVKDKLLTFLMDSIPAEHLRSGMQGARVIHRDVAEDGKITKSVESSLLPFMLRPMILSAQLDQVVCDEDNLCSGTVVIQLNPPVHPKQAVTVALNEYSRTETVGYLFDAPAQTTLNDTVRIPFREVKAGSYLVRIQVDQAESPLEVDSDSESETFDQYIGPQLRIPSPA